MRAFKVLLVGDGGVGKSTLLDAYRLGKFFEHKVTIGLCLSMCTVLLDGRRFRLSIYDFSGQPRFFKMIKAVPSLMKGAHGAIVVFDMSSLPTLMTANEWAEMVRDLNGDIPMVLVGTKADLESEVGEEDIRGVMEKFGIEIFIETSSKLMKNVSEPFKTLTRLMVERARSR